jgi:hypothetical protein
LVFMGQIPAERRNSWRLNSALGAKVQAQS